MVDVAAAEAFTLNDHGLPAFLAHVATLGIGETVGRRLFAQVHQRNVREFEALGRTQGLSKVAREALRPVAKLPTLETIERRRAADGFVKYLFRSPLGGEFEAVRIPLFDTKYVVCISSQVGCALACDFCATGKMGFKRNLQVWEILEQLAVVRSEAERPISGVVFMGMGEPLLNLSAVLEAASVMREPSGYAITGKAITVSTAGVVPGIHRFIEADVPYRLAFSLTSAIPEKRGKVMPVERTHPLPTLVEAIRRYTEVRGDRAMLAYVVISGFNTGLEDAQALARVFEGIPVKLDLIDVTDPSGVYAPPDDAELARFRDHLQLLKSPIARRYSGGKEIGAACGTLAATQRGGEVLSSLGAVAASLQPETVLGVLESAAP